MEKDVKLNTKQRKALPTSSFCGPNRSFPVPDCNHVRAALSLLGRYKGPGDKEKIKECIYSRARKLGCFKTGPGAKKKDDIIEIEAEHDSLFNTLKTKYKNSEITNVDVFVELNYIIKIADLGDSVLINTSSLLFNDKNNVIDAIDYIYNLINTT